MDKNTSQELTSGKELHEQKDVKEKLHNCADGKQRTVSEYLMWLDSMVLHYN